MRVSSPAAAPRRRVFLALLPVASLTVAVPAAQAQRVRPAFEPKLVRKSIVSGTVHFKIVPRQDGLPQEFAPIGSGGWAAVVRIDGHVLASLKHLPAMVDWDTRAAGDGIHEVLVTVRNAGADQEVGIEGAQLIVDNAAADTAAEAASGISAAAATAPVLTLPDTAKVASVAARFTSSHDLLSAQATALLRSGSRLYLGLPGGGIAFCTPDAPMPHGASIGGSVIRLPSWEGSVRSLTVGSGRVWWTTEDGRYVYAYSDATHSVTRYGVTATLTAPTPTPPSPPPDANDTTLSALPPESQDATPPSPDTPSDVPVPPAPTPPKPTGWVRRVALLHGRVLLMGDSGSVRVLDPHSGALSDPTTAIIPGLLPENIRSGTAARLYVATSGDDAHASALVVSVTPAPLPEASPDSDTASVTAVSDTGTNAATPAVMSGAATPAARRRRFLLNAWRCGSDGVWRSIATLPTDADPARGEHLAVSADSLLTAEREGPRFIPNGADPRDLPYALSPGMPSSTDRVAIGGSGLWWEQRGIVFHGDPGTGARDAYLPWNVSGEPGVVLAMAADGDSAWVATTSAGVRRIRPGHPTTRDGYNGYVRARLGSSTLHPPTPRDNRIACAIDIWQGTPYVWGGQSRSGTDCSGFVMRMHQVGGVSIPRTSAEMRCSSRGARVRDELRWGDTLVYPGHCALYIGDGRTAETVGGSRDGSVSHSSVWVHSNVVVRRFLP